MNAHTIYAVIVGQDVANVIVGDFCSCSIISKANYGDAAYVLDVSNCPVQQGDKYINENFYRYNAATGQDELVEWMPTEEDRVSSLEQTNSTLVKNSEDDQRSIVQLELAVADIYEGL